VRSIVVGGAGTIGKAAVNALVAVLHCVEDDDRGNPLGGLACTLAPGGLLRLLHGSTDEGSDRDGGAAIP